ncbi:hypothetical protein PFUGPA_05986 [Plasmodium falciparum Palo Alto/Uganda]|uniref:Erythrocyte membrane protein 1 n=1 Tax=Plasmodium falciparum (isolate Palo Alto / Uganda) TaxID=57270 RepID=W4IPQ5_PLAFP|nr:hypothetical protein PFUGPA_05986 [Plasmodium falciparum Palo Alto/Uganda]
MLRRKAARAAKEPDYNSAKDAKELLDMIGKHVYKKVHREAANYRGKLYGLLTQAKFSDTTRVPNENPCNLNYQYHTNVTSTVINPCEHKSVERFSEVSGGECDDSKIKGSNGGACAPFRRLHVCDRNLEQIKPHTITVTDNLLVDVCMAAQFEGASISGRYPQYVATYGDLGSTMCTVLARSFADIGDIIRGKDLFRGYNEIDREQKVKLENNLKTIFKKIQEKLTGDAQTHYQDNGGNFYQLREDWWDANRAKVWYAMTCGAGTSDKYFRKTCSNDTSHTNEKCRCVSTDPPTFLDYVPQFLRWFEEWAEDFCRKRKHKLKDIIEKCRFDEDHNTKYCDRNGFDCKDTIRAQEKLVKGDDCHKCSVACTNFEPWIKNQKLEFLKQKKKYDDEIKKANGTKQATNGTTNNLYVDEFYKKLQKHCPTAESFLKKLNEEQICKDETHVQKEKISPVNFTKDEETFSHKEYCDTCPWCGSDEKDGKLIDRDDRACASAPTISFDESNATDIQLLSTDKEKSSILEKFKNLCEENNGQTINWKCHYKEKNEYEQGYDKNYCVLQDENENIKDKTIMSFESFFWGWVTEMLKDSIKWRNEHSMCINNKEATKCIGGCKKACECFQKWVDQKKDEWDAIKIHFDKQKNTDNLTHYQVLQGYLSVFFKEDIIKAYGEDKCDELMESFLNFQVSDGINDTQHSNDPIKILLAHEEDEAQKCQQKHSEDKCKEQAKENLARSLKPADIPRNHFEDEKNIQPEFNNHHDAENEEEPEETVENEVQDAVVNGPEDGAVSQPKTQPAVVPAATTEKKEEVNPCEIVNTLFTSDEPKNTFKDACDQKYGYPQRHWGWRCVAPSGKPNDTTSSNDGATGGKDTGGKDTGGKDTGGKDTGGKDTGGKDGAICVPPRRRKLYIGRLTQWASQVPLGDAASSTSTTSSSQLLRDAFIQSAAVETFFLWHKFKEQWRLQNTSQLLLQPPVVDNDSPQSKLLNGEIPPDFLRQMFYTLGDYADILFGKNDIVIGNTGSDSTKDEMSQRESKIKTAIQEFFQSSDKKSTTVKPGSPSGTTPQQTWWQNHAESIWNGMICALTHKTDDPKEVDDAVYNKFFGENNNDNPVTTGTSNGTFTTRYKYTDVKLDEHSGTRPKPQTGDPSSSDTPTLNNPKLSDFVKLPPFFRWLHEWGSDFCGKRARMLKNVKKACREKHDGGDPKYCSGDGYDCEQTYFEHDDMFKDVNCPDCVKECRKYRKWIGIKFEEFHKQEKKYKGEHEKLTKGNNCSGGDGDDNKEYCEEIKEKNTADKFLAALKHCKDNQGNSDQDDEDELNKIKFEDIPQTFSRSTYCKTCPPNKVNCNRRGRGKNVECTPVKRNEWQSVFNGIPENGGKTTTITVEMIDRRAPYMENDLKDLFKTSSLFKGIRKQNWTCKFNKAQNKDVCKLDQFKDNIDLNEYITFKVFLEYWLEDFIEGYYLLKKKKLIEKCTPKEGETCSEGNSKNDCACVKEWVAQKSTQWEKIQEHFNNRKPDHDKTYTIEYKVRTFLETLIPRMDLVNGEKKLIKLSQFDKSCGCSADASSEKESGKQYKKSDIIDCLLKKLAKKAEKCKEKDQTCTDPQPQTPHLPDDEEENIEENPVDPPNICPTPDPEPEAQDEGGCTPDAKAEEEEKEEEKDKGVEEEQEKEPRLPPPPEPPEEKAPAPAPEVPAQPLPSDNTSDILKTTIPFGIALALTSIALLFLKKKTKASVANLFQILQIPKGDYDIPTLKSSNRYIPYASDRYKVVEMKNMHLCLILLI